MGTRFVVRRLLGIIPTLASILVLTFLLVHASAADPSQELAGDGATPERIQEIRHQMGYDRPLGQQFVTYVTDLARGNLGMVDSLGAPVSEVIASRIRPTLLLTGTALVMSSVLGLFLGALAARRPLGPVDLAISTGSLVGYAVPAFWLGQIAVIIFAVHLGWFPLSGYVDSRSPPVGLDRWTDIGYHLILPALVLATSEIALVTRITRGALVQELGQDYVLTARAKGIPEDIVVSRHAMRNAMLPVVTVIGTRIGFLLSGSLVVETVFGWPGLGSALRSARGGDEALVVGIVLLVATGVLVTNVLIDLLYLWIDPRARSR
ncbi:MAG TPA: ABC transporter permease [Acidimicrobiales bacterium]|nr:ABC transporter permease [Acidimicrobiales bacterium]